MRLSLRKGPGGLSCRQVGRVLQAVLDEEQTPATMAKVADHLEACRDCGLEAEVYRRIKDVLRSKAELPPDSVERLRTFGETLLDADEQ